MSNKIKHVDQIQTIGDRKILFDTNIWIFIEGLNVFSAKRKQLEYERAYKYLRKNGNVIITNEYVLSEFCNRSIKLAYELAKDAAGSGQGFMSLKQFRVTEDGINALEVARDTCLNIVNDCEFCSCHDKYYQIDSVLNEYAKGMMDFTDIIISRQCGSESYFLMTDDGDYANCDIEIFTANKRLAGV